jgi:hypothetical protein
LCDLANPDGPDYRRDYADLILGKTRSDPEPDPTSGFETGGEPNLLGKAANLARATASHVAAGMPLVDDATYEERLSICRSCVGPGGYWDAAREVCMNSSCGCAMKVKTRWAEQRCPIGRWEPAQGATPGRS